MEEPILTCKYPLPITMGSLSLILSQEKDYINVNVSEEENGRQEVYLDEQLNVSKSSAKFTTSSKQLHSVDLEGEFSIDMDSIYLKGNLTERNMSDLKDEPAIYKIDLKITLPAEK